MSIYNQNAIKVSGAGVKFTLSDYEIRRYSFKYAAPNSRYAKGWEDERELVVVGDISRIIEKNRKTLDAIRLWAKTPYKDSETYYNSVKATYTYSDDVVREIEFTHAFVKDYYEKLDTHTGHGTFTIVFRQKVDKLSEMVIGPEGGALRASRGTVSLQSEPTALEAVCAGKVNPKVGEPISVDIELKNTRDDQIVKGILAGDSLCLIPYETFFNALGLNCTILEREQSFMLSVPQREEIRTLKFVKYGANRCVELFMGREQTFLFSTVRTSEIEKDKSYQVEMIRGGVSRVEYKYSTMDLIQQLEGEPFLTPRINDIAF